MELFKLLGTIAVENDQANKAIEETSTRAEDASNKTSGAFQKIGHAAGAIVKGIATAGVALGGAWLAAIEGSREYRAEMAKLDTAFVVNGHSSQAAKQTYSDLNAVLGDTGQAVEASQHLAMLAENEKELQTWTDICTGVYATFGESLPIESLAEASQEVSRSGVLTGGLVDALVWAGISEEKFQEKLDACSNEQERQKLIMDTLNGKYAKASEQYQKTNKDVMDARKAQEKLTNAFSEFGRVGEPILTAIKSKVAEMVTAAVPKLEALIKKVKDLKKWVQDNKQTIHNWASVIIGATVSVGAFLLVLKWGAIMAAASKAIKGVRAAILLFNAALRANPIGLVISLLAGLVAAFIYLWKNNKGFRDFWLKMWDKIQTAAKSAVKRIKAKFEDIRSALKTVRKTFGDIKDTISEKLQAAQDKVQTVVDKIKGFFPLKIGKILSSLKIPKISVSGGKAPFGIAGKGKLPSFNVKWNAEGGILTEPTIFGMTKKGTLLGGGEAGREAIAPISLLQAYVKEAVQGENDALIRTLIAQNERLMDFLKRIVPKAVLLDTGALVGDLIPALDVGMSDRLAHVQRGNTR